MKTSTHKARLHILRLRNIFILLCIITVWAGKTGLLQAGACKRPCSGPGALRPLAAGEKEGFRFFKAYQEWKRIVEDIAQNGSRSTLINEADIDKFCNSTRRLQAALTEMAAKGEFNFVVQKAVDTMLTALETQRWNKDLNSLQRYIQYRRLASEQGIYWPAPDKRGEVLDGEESDNAIGRVSFRIIAAVENNKPGIAAMDFSQLPWPLQPKYFHEVSRLLMGRIHDINQDFLDGKLEAPAAISILYMTREFFWQLKEGRFCAENVAPAIRGALPGCMQLAEKQAPDIVKERKKRFERKMREVAGPYSEKVKKDMDRAIRERNPGLFVEAMRKIQVVPTKIIETDGELWEYDLAPPRIMAILAKILLNPTKADGQEEAQVLLDLLIISFSNNAFPDGIVVQCERIFEHLTQKLAAHRAYGKMFDARIAYFKGQGAAEFRYYYGPVCTIENYEKAASRLVEILTVRGNAAPIEEITRLHEPISDI